MSYLNGIRYDTIPINYSPLVSAQRHQKDVYPNTGYFDELVGKANDQDQATGTTEESVSTRNGTDRARFR